MRLFNKKVIAYCIVGVAFLFSINTDAQCKRFTVIHCLPTLDPFVHNGQLTSAVLNPGDSADVEMTFNKGKTYRVLVCSQDLIGNVEFKVLDNTRKILYKSNPDEKNPYWDFKVDQTQKFIIQITVPPMERSIQKTNLVPNGCVSLLVGFQK